MSKQLENYIVLKPISERFNQITKEITDEEIRSIILSTLKEKIEDEIVDVSFTEDIQEIAEKWIGENSMKIEGMIEDSFVKRLK